MSKVKFKYPFDVEAEDRITGFKGTIIVRRESINGAITYGLQPRQRKDDSDYVADAKAIDEGYIKGPEQVSEEVEFEFNCGDPVKNFINGFEGIVTERKQWLNGCIQYCVEAKMIKSDLHGMVMPEKTFWEQEIELIKSKKAVKTNKKRTGGPSESFTSTGDI